jgi:uncharacterized protein (TIGR03790 family)
MMKRKTFGVTIMLFSMLFGFAQMPNYDDVGVIVNMNSQVSQDIAAYFRQARNIPEINIIPVYTVTDEIIDTIEFRNIQYQIKNYILENNLENQLNYLVTTKGVPFDIQVDSCSVGGSEATVWYCAAVESELTLLLSADSARILKKSYRTNPYYGSIEHQNTKPTDLLLVSRLDGHGKEEVLSLIDRSGPNTYVNKETAKFIFDISYVDDPYTFNLFAEKMYPAIDTLTSRGWNAIFDGDTLVPLNETNVLGFIAFIQSGLEEQLNYSWEKGSFAELMIPTANFTFYDSLFNTNRPDLADILAEGCTSGSGFVHPYFASQSTDFAILFGRYTEERDTAYNLAESYYMATKTLSWMNILVGDPKTTLTTQSGSSVKDFEGISDFNVYPNPAREEITIVFSSIQSDDLSLSVVDQIGNTIMSKHLISKIGRNSFQLNISEIPSGFYFLLLQDQTRGFRTTKLIISR